MITDPRSFKRITVLDTVMKDNYVLNDITSDNSIELRIMKSESNEGFHDADLVLIEAPIPVYCENISYMIVQKFIDFYIEQNELNKQLLDKEQNR